MARLRVLLVLFVILGISCTTQNPVTQDKGSQGDGLHKDIGVTLPDEGLLIDEGLLPPDEGLLPPDEGLLPPDQNIQPVPDNGITPVPDKGVTPVPDIGLINGTCKNARTLVWSGSSITVTGTTTGFANEYGTGINCGNLAQTLPGNQVYYKLDLVGGKEYRFHLNPEFSAARLYIFTVCGIATINKDCGSNGASGDIGPSISRPNTGSLFFKAPKTGTFYVAVDGNSPTSSGTFKLTITPYTAPTNTTCAKAKLLKLVSNTVSVQGNTTGVANEFGRSINCRRSGRDYDGNQLYYQLAMTAGHTYRITLSPSFGADMYVFRPTCTASAINADCGSGGVNGLDFNSQVPSGGSATMSFRPRTSGYYNIAVDSRYTGNFGDFTLKIEDYVPPTNSTCTGATALTLSGGRVAVNGTNSGASNQFTNQIRCGQSSTYAQDGNQVYYKLTLTAGRTYKFSLTPTYYGSLYLFRTTCTATAINGDCSSNGTNGFQNLVIYPNSTESTIFQPGTTGTYTLAVDSMYSTPSYGQGTFKLVVEETLVANNGKCTSASALTFISGKATVTGDTTGVANEFGNSIRCGQSSYYAQDGPQVYYWASLTANTTYKFSLSPTFSAYMYLFGSSCSTTNINSDCGSNYSRGFIASAATNSTRSVLYTPTTGGIHRLAVDSRSSSAVGKFKLEVELFKVPANGKCAGAQAVTLNATGSTTVTGDTTGIPNEFGSQISCGTFTPAVGNQLYYKFQLTAGKTYTFTLRPSYSYAGFIIFRNSCTPTNINTDCGSSGKTGALSASAFSGRPAVVRFTPSTTGTYHVSVDSVYTTRYGQFSLEIR